MRGICTEKSRSRKVSILSSKILSLFISSTNKTPPNRGNLEKALAIAELRSPSSDDGTIARILFKMAQVRENDILPGYEAQQLRTRADLARKKLTGSGEGHILHAVHVLDDEGNVDLDEEDDAYDALVPIFFR